jgi:nucleoside-diphosphate-sugar epimerase
VTPYGRAKLEAEKLVLDAGKRHSLHVCVLRLPLVYGLDNDGNIPRMITAVDSGRFPSLPDVGNKRSMVHVADVVQAALLAAEKPAANGQIYLVTDGQTYSTRQLYAMICYALHRPVPTWYIPTSVLRAMGRTGDLIGRLRGRPFMFDSTVLQKLLGSAWYSSEKIVRDLGYRPTRTLEDAIGEMVDEYRRTKDSGLKGSEP